MVKERGISTLIGIIIIVVVAIVAFGGVFGYQYVTQPKEQPAAENNQPIVGGDRDANGCIGSAGYTWCEAKQKCLRQWEEPCQADATAGWKTYINNEYGFEFKYNPKYELNTSVGKTGPDDAVGQLGVQIGSFSSAAPVVPTFSYTVIARKGISTLADLQSFFMKPQLMSEVQPIINTTLGGQNAVDMKFYQNVGAGYYFHAVGAVKNNTLFIINKQQNKNNNNMEEEFRQMLSTFKFTK